MLCPVSQTLRVIIFSRVWSSETISLLEFDGVRPERISIGGGGGVCGGRMLEDVRRENGGGMCWSPCWRLRRKGGRAGCGERFVLEGRSAISHAGSRRGISLATITWTFIDVANVTEMSDHSSERVTEYHPMLMS